MPAPRMLVIAGPPGGGKSSIFSVSDFAGHFFNADDRAAQLNAGSYEGIPLFIRAIVNRQFEEFVHTSIRSGVSFALETTLRSPVTFEQAKLAKPSGFQVSMRGTSLWTQPNAISSG